VRLCGILVVLVGVDMHIHEISLAWDRGVGLRISCGWMLAMRGSCEIRRCAFSFGVGYWDAYLLTIWNSKGFH
jgi:hypothetical protein